MRGTNTQARKARAQRLGRALTQFDRSPGPLRQAERKRLDRAADACRRDASASAVVRDPTTFSPATAGRAHTVVVDIMPAAQAQRRDLSAQIVVVAVAGIQQNHAARQAGRTGPAQLLDRDLRFGLERNLLRNARLAPTRAVARPLLRQIQPPCRS